MVDLAAEQRARIAVERVVDLVRRALPGVEVQQADGVAVFTLPDVAVVAVDCEPPVTIATRRPTWELLYAGGFPCRRWWRRAAAIVVERLKSASIDAFLRPALPLRTLPPDVPVVGSSSRGPGARHSGPLPVLTP